MRLLCTTHGYKVQLCVAVQELNCVKLCVKAITNKCWKLSDTLEQGEKRESSTYVAENKSSKVKAGFLTHFLSFSLHSPAVPSCYYVSSSPVPVSCGTIFWYLFILTQISYFSDFKLISSAIFTLPYLILNYIFVSSFSSHHFFLFPAWNLFLLLLFVHHQFILCLPSFTQ